MITSSDQIDGTIKVKAAKGTVVRDVHFISANVVVDAKVSDKGHQAHFKDREWVE